MSIRSGALRSARLAEAVAVVAASFAFIFTVGATLRTALGLPGIVLADAIGVALPAWWWAHERDLDLALGTGAGPAETPGATQRAAALGLAGRVAAAGLAGLGAFYLMSLVEQEVLERILPTPPELVEAMKRLLDPRAGASALASRVLALALAPALAEELLFRGAVLDALGANRRAAVVSALLFGAFHGSVFRMIPAAGLGLVLGWVRLRSRSLWPAIAFHLINNLAVILLFTLGRDRPWPLDTALGIGLLAGALVAFVVGMRRCQIDG
jgi:membrane protease YdiL (CAAX protease family)